MAVPDTGPAGGSTAATGPEQGRVKAAEEARVAIRGRTSEPRGRGPASSAPFPFLAAVEGLVREQAMGTITEPAMAMGTTSAAVTVADLAAVLVVGMALVRVAGTGAGRGLVKATDLTTVAVTRTATVTATARPPLSPSTCGRSSGRF